MKTIPGLYPDILEESHKLFHKPNEENIPQAELSPAQKEYNLMKKYTAENPDQNQKIRQFSFGKPNTNNKFPNNKISTAKYSFLTFFPVNLLEQFTKIANVYFLVLAILQCFPAISNTDGIPTLLVPLSVVILVSMTKDFIEDFKRQRSDNEENNNSVLVLDIEKNEFVPKKWEELRVGDKVKILCDNQIPADLIIIRSSMEGGICYVETKNLDGETNLKHKIVRKELQEFLENSEENKENPLKSTLNFSGEINCENPNFSLDTFEGTLKFNNERIIPLTSEQILLRGMNLRNTDFIIGIIVFTGMETKIQQNSTRTKSKRSIMENQTHHLIMVIFIIQVTISLLLAICGLIWSISSSQEAIYLQINMKKLSDKPFFILLKLFGSWLLMTVYFFVKYKKNIDN